MGNTPKHNRKPKPIKKIAKRIKPWLPLLIPLIVKIIEYLIQ
jgi:hypothetical protein